MYRLKKSKQKDSKIRAHLFGSGTILNEAIKAQELLEKNYNVATDVWSITSYKELHRDALDSERWNMMHPEKNPRLPYISKLLENEKGVFVAVSDYLSRYIPLRIPSLAPFGMLGIA